MQEIVSPDVLLLDVFLLIFQIKILLDLLVAFGVLSCRILDCASLFIYVHEHDPMLTEETAVFDRLHLLTQFKSRQKRSVFPVEYCLESVEGYSECTIHKDEPEPRKGNVTTVYFINQARANTRISGTEFMYDESMRLQMVTYI